MPAFRSLNESQLHALVGYVRLLQGKGDAPTLPGDPKHGREIFFGKGDCARCHSVAGQGGFMGPDLTNHAMTSSAGAIRDEIIRSPRVPAPRYRKAVLTTAAGDRIEGVVRNEDNFSVQLQTTDGNFHLLKKAELKAFEYANSSLMPADYRSRLSEWDLNDLTSYLLTTPDRKNSAPPQKKWEEDEE
jgi:putative heme-binding domain-containing protein